MPTFSGQLGTVLDGNLQLGADGDAPYTPPSMPSTALPFIAHLYNNDWSFRASLGPILNRPLIKQSLNGGYQPLSIQLPTKNTTVQPGNLIVLTEQGGDGSAIFGGIVEQVPEILQANGPASHQVAITPFVAELGDAYLNTNYTTATEVAQMVRDAIAKTTHLRCTPYSVPNTGVTAIHNFTYAPALEVVNLARLIAGVQYAWFVDAIGVVWFQAINTTASAMFTVREGVDYNGKNDNGGDITGLKNFVLVTGGIPLGASTPATGTYNNATSQAQYGLRAMNPPINLPSCTDQTTIQNIANTVGGVFNRVINRVELNLPTYSKRILLGQPGGATMRYWEPNKNALVESETGTGYSANYVVLDVETDGIQQKVVLGDVPVTSISDLQYQIDRIASRAGMAWVAQPPFIGGNVTTIGSTGAIQSAASGPRLVLDGSIPMVSANDGTYLRAQHGNLSAYTDPAGVISPAMWGFRALDASGNLVFDSGGLVSVLTLIGGTPLFDGTAHGFSNTTWGQIAGSQTVTFTLTRQVTVVGMVSMSYNSSNGSLDLGLAFDGTTVPDGKILNLGVQTVNVPVTLLVAKTLAAGSHTLYILGEMVAGSSAIAFTYTLLLRLGN